MLAEGTLQTYVKKVTRGYVAGLNLPNNSLLAFCNHTMASILQLLWCVCQLWCLNGCRICRNTLPFAS